MDKDFHVVVAGCGDPDLVNELMGLIGRYCEANGVVPCPVELRDTMLAVAALAHLEAGKMECTATAMSAEDFADAARENFRDVSGVLAMPKYCRQTAARVRH
jgi:hypothetical protein